MNSNPPMSEIFEAMAQGVMAPYLTIQSGVFDNRSFDHAREQSAMYHAIAAVYRKYEQHDTDRVGDN